MINYFLQEVNFIHAKMLLMRKILHYLFISVLLSCLFIHSADAKLFNKINTVNQPEEVILESDNQEEVVQSAEISEQDSGSSLREKLKNVYNLEIDKYDRPEYLFREVLTHKCKEIGRAHV